MTRTEVLRKEETVEAAILWGWVRLFDTSVKGYIKTAPIL